MCVIVFQCLGVFWSILECVEVFGSKLECVENGLKCFGVFWSVLECFGVLWNVLECFEMFRSVAKITIENDSLVNNRPIILWKICPPSATENPVENPVTPTLTLT